MQERQLFLRRSVVWQRGQNPSYMISMVNQSKICVPSFIFCLRQNTRAFWDAFDFMTLRVLNLDQPKSWMLLEVHWTEIYQNWAKRSVACNLVSWFASLHRLPTNLPLRYCIPMDSPHPMLSTELQFFDKGTGRGKSRGQLFSMLRIFNVLTIEWLIYSSTGGYIHQIWWSNNQWIYWLEWCGKYRSVGHGKEKCWKGFSDSLSSQSLQYRSSTKGICVIGR